MLGAAALTIVCCLGEVLIAAGVLDAIGTVLANSFPIAAALLSAVGGKVRAVHRHRSRHADRAPAGRRTNLGTVTDRHLIGP